MDMEADRTVLVPACHTGDIPASINKNGLHRLQAVFYRMISTSDIL